MPPFGKGFRLGVGPDQDRWFIVKKLGEGQFAEVYEVKDMQDSEKRYALKIERRRDVRSVKQEFKVLKKIQERNPTLVCEVHSCGTFGDRFFMVMELLGNNVAEARRGAGGRFGSGVARQLARCTLAALEEVHGAGFVHRDVKPANFAVSPYFSDPLTGTWKVIDFGLARRYLDDAGDVLPERLDTSFRGSTTYASVNAHAEQDLGRRDDLWSWLYCVVELFEGTLPWRADTKDPDSREAVLRLKQAAIADPSRLFRNCPVLHPVMQLSHYIASLGFLDAPDYGAMYGMISQLPDELPGMEPVQPGQPPTVAAGGVLAPPGGMGAWGMAPGQGGGGGMNMGAGAEEAALYGAQQQQQQAAFQQFYQHPHQQQQQQQQQQAHQPHQPHQPLQQMPQQDGGPGFQRFWPPQQPAWADPSAQPMHPHQPPQQPAMQAPPHPQHPQHPLHAPPGRASLEGPPTSPPLDGDGGGQPPPEPPLPPLPPGGPSGPPGPGPGHAGHGPMGHGPTGQPAASPGDELAAELAEQLLEEALAEKAGPNRSREAAQVAEVAEYVELVKQGHVSDEAHEVAGRLMGLEPLEALATLAYVVDALAAHVTHGSAPSAATALAALGSYTQDAARRTMIRYCRTAAAQHLQQQQQQQQHQVPQQQPQQQPPQQHYAVPPQQLQSRGARDAPGG